jgi:hypothetical protein
MTFVTESTRQILPLRLIMPPLTGIGTLSGIESFSHSFTSNLKQQDNRDYDKHDRDEEDPRYRRDKSVSAIRTNTNVQTNVLFASWARLHYGQCILSVLWVSTIRCINPHSADE